MVFVLVALGWSVAAVLVAVVFGTGIRIADERAEADAWRVPLLDDAAGDPGSDVAARSR